MVRFMVQTASEPDSFEPVQGSAHGENRTESSVLGSANVALNRTEPDFDSTILWGKRPDPEMQSSSQSMAGS